MSRFILICIAIASLLTFPNVEAQLCGNTTEQIQNLKNCLVGPGFSRFHFVSRGDLTYGALNHQWQLADGEKHPLGYMLPRSPMHVGLAMACAEKHSIQVIPKSGGHSYASYSFGGNECTAIMDLQFMTHLKVNPIDGTVRLGPGHLLGPMLLQLWEAGNYTLALGTYQAVGLGGLVLGGGHGYQIKSLGLAVQNVLEIEMVDWKGDKLRANKKKNSDLFWALRGAGIGSYGIVTKFRLKLYKAPQKIVRSEEYYNMSSFTTMFTQLQNLELDSDAPKNLYCCLTTSEQPNIFAINCFEFDPPGAVHYKRYFPGTDAVRSTEKVLTYLEFARVDSLESELDFEPYFHANRTLDEPRFSKIKSVYARRPLLEAEMIALGEILEWKPHNVEFFINPYGGKVNELAKEDKFYSFAHTGEETLYLLGFSTSSKNEIEFTASVTWMRQAFHKLENEILKDPEPHCYQNYADTDLTSDYLERYYGIENLRRLTEIKRKYDPNNRFNYAQSIPLEYKQ